jgi:hypothetical protein
MSCIICGKPTRPGTDICSSTCALQKTPELSKEDNEEPENDKRSRTVLSLTRSLEEVTMLNNTKLQEVPVVQVKHRWMKNRNLVSNRTVLSFDDCGIAKMARLGSVLEDIGALMKRFPGQMTICRDEEKVEKVEEKPVVVEERVEEVKVEEVKVEEVKVEEPMEEVEDLVEEFVKELKVEDLMEVEDKVLPPIIRKKKQPLPYTKTKTEK